MDAPRNQTIDVLKGIAISMVLIVHSANLFHFSGAWNYIFSYGQMGTQLFFMLSAFSLSLSWDKKKDSEKSYRKYFIKRIKRIAPGYWFMIVLYVLIAFITNDVLHQQIPLPIDRDPLHILVNVLFLNGLVPVANNLVVISGWYVGTAMIFYAIFPMLFTLYQQRYEKNSKSPAFITIEFFLFVLVIRLFIELFNHYTYYSGNNSFMYFSFINQLPVFCMGIQLFFDLKTRRLKKNISFLQFVLCTMISYYLFQFNTVLSFTVIPFVSGYSFYCLYCGLNPILKRKVSVLIKMLSSFGMHSYAEYLAQPLVIFWGLAVFTGHFPTSIHNICLYFILLIPVFILTFLLGRLIEISSDYCFQLIQNLE